MNAKKKKYIAIFVFSLVIGTMLVIQTRASAGERIYTSRKAVTDYETMIKSEEETTSDLKKQIIETKKLLLDYETDKESEETQVVLDNIVSENEKYSILSGACDVKGPGVVITVDDGSRALYEGEDLNNLLVHDIDILMIINELKKAGAEAISVNDQRIIDSTSINCSGWTIRINGITYARPFTIKAIGNSRKMANTLLAEEGYGTNLKEWGVNFTLETLDEIVIKAYNGSRQLTYAAGVGGKEE